MAWFCLQQGRLLAVPHKAGRHRRQHGMVAYSRSWHTHAIRQGEVEEGMAKAIKAGEKKLWEIVGRTGAGKRRSMAQRI